MKEKMLRASKIINELRVKIMSSYNIKLHHYNVG